VKAALRPEDFQWKGRCFWCQKIRCSLLRTAGFA